MRPRTQTQKRLPAFGREILELRRRGLVPAVQRGGVPCTRFIVALDTWDYGRTFVRVVVTQEHDPSTLDFSFLAGLDVELVWHSAVTDIKRRDACIRAVLQGNPERLMLWDVGGNPARLTWIKSKLVGIELAEYAA